MYPTLHPKLNLTVLGATGSIGQQTLDVVKHHRSAFNVYALSARNNRSLLFEQCLAFEPRYALLEDQEQATALAESLRAADLKTEVLFDSEGLRRVVSDEQVEVVMAAISGFAGVEPVLWAAEAGKTILLANKESVVSAGHLLKKLVAEMSANILPVDSEHNAIYQCLPDPQWRMGQPLPDSIEQLVLTASGGPFLDLPASQLAQVTPEQAWTHPNWQMGKKISVDSATMVNKALELIECCYLFDISHESVEILIHPESVVHSIIRYRDNSFIAQMSDSDMRIAVSYTLARAVSHLRGSDAWLRLHSNAPAIDWQQQVQLNFKRLDDQRFPVVEGARRAWEQGPAALIAFNAINEVLVDLFLRGRLAFDQISTVLLDALSDCPADAVDDWQQICQQDQQARRHCRRRLGLDEEGVL